MPFRALMLSIVVLLLAAPAASARGPFELGLQDDPVFVTHPKGTHGTARQRLPRSRGFSAARSLRARTVRMNVVWAWTAPRPTWRRMPRRTVYDFRVYDVAVDDALRRGLTPQLTLTGPAPAWATRDRRVGVVAPDARKFARFAAAAAAHFAGRVERWSIWNEPNWFSLLQPVASAPTVYRDLFRGASHAIRRADPEAKVLLGEFAPMGRRGRATSPLAFLRAMTCRDGALRPLRRCVTLEADGVALHPYTLRYPATFPGPSADDVTTGSLSRLVRALRDLRRVRALRTPAGGAPPIYLTEYGFFGKTGPIPLPLAARYLRDGLQLAYRIPQVRQVILYELAGARERNPRWDTALLDFRGRPRPLYRAAVGWARAHLPSR